MIEELPAIIQHAVIGGKIGGPLVEVVRLEAHQRIVAARESKLAAVQAGADSLADALQKMLLAACWFHEGPYGPSPERADYDKAKAILAAYQAGTRTGDVKEVKP